MPLRCAAPGADVHRAAILRAGHDLLVTNGYEATTMAAVARAAGVSVETVYKGFGNKPELVGQILGTAVVGDDEPVALIDRAEMQAALHAGSGAQILAAFADVSTHILTRIGPLLATVLIAARAAGPELRGIARTAGEQRHNDFRRVVDAIAATGDLHPTLDPDRAADILWAIGITRDPPAAHHRSRLERRRLPQLAHHHPPSRPPVLSTGRAIPPPARRVAGGDQEGSPCIEG